MTLASPDFPSSAAFDAINASLQSSEADRKDAIKQGGAVFAFALKNAEGKVESWYIDLKTKGEVGKGSAPEGGKANGMFRSFLFHVLFLFLSFLASSSRLGLSGVW